MAYKKKVVKTEYLVPEEMKHLTEKLKPNEMYSLPAGEYNYKPIWIIKEIPTNENKIDQYMITFGKGRPRATVAITAIHDASLVK